MSLAQPSASDFVEAGGQKDSGYGMQRLNLPKLMRLCESNNILYQKYVVAAMREAVEMVIFYSFRIDIPEIRGSRRELRRDIISTSII